MNKHNRFVAFSNLVINHGLQPRRGNNNYHFFNYINNLGSNLKSYFNPKDNLRRLELIERMKVNVNFVIGYWKNDNIFLVAMFKLI